MSKDRPTAVPIPGAVAKTKSKPRPSNTSLKAPLSQEYVRSSDDSEAEKTPRRKKFEKQTKQTTPVQISIHRSKAGQNSNGVSQKKQALLPKKTQVPLPREAFHAKQFVNEELESDTASSNESDNQSTKSAEYQRRTSDNSPERDGSTESASGSNNSSDDADDDAGPAIAPDVAEEHSRPAPSHTVEFRAARPFLPPKEFSEVRITPKTISQAVSIFGNLKGKQLWHISAPAILPLSELKELVTERLQTGEAVLVHKGVDYGGTTSDKNERATRQVLIPHTSGYKNVSTSISRTLCLRQIVRLPKISAKQADLNTGSKAAASITRSTIRAPRPQVKGLRMRYFHSGFGDEEPGTLGSTDSETEVSATAGLGVPTGPQAPTRPEKRRHHEVNGTERSDSSRKHKKYHNPEDIVKREERRAKKERKRAKEMANAKS